MLCVNRALGQRVIMRVPNGPVISVIVVRVGHGQRVRLGIDAPTFVSVDREEIDAAKGNEVVSEPDKLTESRSITRLWKAMGEPMHMTDDALIRKAAAEINQLRAENAALKSIQQKEVTSGKEAQQA